MAPPATATGTATPAATARFGVNLMAQGWTGEPIITGPALLRHRARLLQRMAETGLDHVMIGDHVMFQGGTGNDGLADAASVMTATEDLGVYLAVYLLVLRHPLTVARQILTVIQFGPGRLSLGLGIAGDDRREVEACGIDPRTRGRRMDEALDIVRRLLTGETVSPQGEFFQLDQARRRGDPHRRRARHQRRPARGELAPRHDVLVRFRRPPRAGSRPGGPGHG